jgi:hypothetical protein
MEEDDGVPPEWIRAAALPALGDMQGAGAIELGVEWRPEGDDAGVLVASEAGSASSVRRRFWRDDGTAADLTVGVANWLQEQVFPESAGAWGQPRPPCPGHPHPMRATVLEGAAWWVCPASSAPIRMIGQG